MENIYFKVITGYGTDDYIEVDIIEDLEKAIWAHLTRKVVRINGEMISGAEIKHIKPDHARMMGYVRGYQLKSDDWTEINKHGFVHESRKLLSDTMDKVKELMMGNMSKYIGIDRRELPEFKELKQLQ